MNRYQLYLRLVDLSCLIALVHLVRVLGQIVNLWGMRMPQPLGLVFGIVTILNLFLAVFLIVARFMRDEFAERIWHQAAEWFVYFLAVVPLILAFVLPLMEDWMRARVNDTWFEPDLLEEFAKHPGSQWGFVGGVGHAVIMFAIIAPPFFICIYRLLMWRDSR